MAFTTRELWVREVDEFLEEFGDNLLDYRISAFHAGGYREPKVIVTVRHEDIEDSWY